MNDYSPPSFLDGICSKENYKKWLDRKVNISQKDRERYEKPALNYKARIHKAVEESKGKDFYTNKKLDWKLIGKWNNEKAKNGGFEYRKKFRNLPTVDHFNPEKFDPKNPDFRICSWIVNDVKNDLSHSELIQLCKILIKNS